VPAFYYEHFDRRPLDRGGTGSEWPYPVGRPVWKARFAPTEPGLYRGMAVRGASLNANGLPPGTYRVEWWDTHKGEMARRESAKPGADQIELEVPGFAGDIACKIILDQCHI
jgi:hypothetical protein